jgi:hypothetical protein
MKRERPGRVTILTIANIGASPGFRELLPAITILSSPFSLVDGRWIDL